MKSGTDSSPGGDLDRRNVEANTIRTNSASAAVGANAHVIYAGDFNVNDSSEAAYQTMISGTLSGIGTVGRAVDVLNPSNNWNTSGTSSSPYQGLFTETATSVRFRDDFQFVTNPMLNQPGMQLVPNSLTTFGNGGGIFHQSVTNSANSAALVDLRAISVLTRIPLKRFDGPYNRHRSPAHRCRLQLRDRRWRTEAILTTAASSTPAFTISGEARLVQPRTSLPMATTTASWTKPIT